MRDNVWALTCTSFGQWPPGGRAPKGLHVWRRHQRYDITEYLLGSLVLLDPAVSPAHICTAISIPGRVKSCRTNARENMIECYEPLLSYSPFVRLESLHASPFHEAETQPWSCIRRTSPDTFQWPRDETPAHSRSLPRLNIRLPSVGARSVCPRWMRDCRRSMCGYQHRASCSHAVVNLCATRWSM